MRLIIYSKGLYSTWMYYAPDRIAFDAGEELSEHTTPYESLVHVVDGRARVSVAGEWFEVGEGEAIVLPADVPHAVAAGERFKMLLTMLRG
jgi:quercetin dioxygenase-like cupin family protein